MSNCIFCKIINNEIPSQKVFENEKVVAFKDINPAAPIHILVVPKVHIESIDTLDELTSGVLPDLFLAVKAIAKELGLVTGYRIVSNVGTDAGQTVNHLHFHILGGRSLNLVMC